MDKKYFDMLSNIIKEKIDITKLYILSCCPFDTDGMNWAVMEYTYKCWLDADTDLDLAKLTAIICDNWKEIQNDEITDTEIIDMTVTY